MKRYTPGLCANELHELNGPDTVRVNSRGEEECRGCHDISKQRHAKGESRKNGTNFCRRNHEYTPENTYMNPVNGRRTCRECARITQRAYVLRKSNK